jgi:VIT1/CCC1 family predicted Fe2+/Mn2+ transporter
MNESKETCLMSPHEQHRSHRSTWLRAAVLGANDGIVSTASLIIGVASAGSDHDEIMLAGLAGLVAGAMSMAAGEYVSVSSQADTEAADLEQERISLKHNPEFEHRELAAIYEGRGLEPDLAVLVARQLMAHDALEAHARDEIGITDTSKARPIQAAISSAMSFVIGALLPLLAAFFLAENLLIEGVGLLSLLFLGGLGALAARTGGAPVLKGSLRVTLWGALAMILTALVGSLFGIST